MILELLEGEIISCRRNLHDATIVVTRRTFAVNSGHSLLSLIVTLDTGDQILSFDLGKNP